MPSPRPGKILAVLVVLLIVLVVVGVFLPPIAAATVGRGIVANLVAAQVDGTVEVDAVKLSWSAPQRVRGLHVTDAAGRKVASLDVTLTTAFVPLVLGSIDRWVVAVDGEINGTLREDGSTSFQALLAETAPGDDAAAPPSPGGPAPGVRVDVGALKVSLTLEPTAESENVTTDFGRIVLESLSGHIDLEPGGATSIDLASPVSVGADKGRVAMKATANGLLGAGGGLTPRGATVDATLEVDALPVPFDAGGRRIEHLELTLATQDLADDLGLKLVADTVGNGETSTLRGDLSFAAPVRDDGTFNVALGTIRGTVAGARVPTALLQPFLAESPIVLARDLGPTVDVDANFTPVSADPASGSNVVVTLTAAPNGSLAATAEVRPDGAVPNGTLDMRVLVQPALVAGLVGASEGPALVRAVPLRLRLGSFGLPAPDAGGKIRLADVRFEGSLRADAPLEMGLGGAKPPIVAEGAEFAFSSPALADGARLTGTAAVAGGRLEIDEQLSGLLDADGGLDAGGLRAAGTVALRGLDGAMVASLLGVAKEAAADRSAVDAALADELASGPVDLVLTTSDRGGALGGQAELTTRNGKATVGIERGAERFTLAPSAQFTVQPDLVATLLAGREDPARLAAPVRVRLDADAFDLPAGIFDDEGNLPDVPLKVRLAVDTFRMTRTGEPTVRIGGFTADAAGSLRGDSDVALKARASLLQDDDTPIGAVACDLVVNPGAETIMPRGTVTITDLAVPAAETVLSLAPGTIADWTGSPGNLSLVLAAEGAVQRVSATCAFPYVNGAVAASIEDDVLDLQAERLAVTMRKTTLERLLNVPPEEGKPVAPETRLTVAKDVPMTAAVRRLRVPLGSPGTPVNAAAYDVDVALNGGPLEIAGADGVRSTLDTLLVTATSDDLSKGVDFTIVGRSAATASTEAGRLDVTGRLNGVLAADLQPTLDDAKLDMTAAAQHVPTILADAALGMQQLLVAAVGVEMGANFVAKGFSRSEGRVDGTITTPNGELTIALRAEPGFLVTVDGAPVQGSLDVKPPLRERLLRKIHPILADIRSTEEPLRFRVTGPTRLPTDGDVSKLNGDFTITVGKVEFTAGSQTLGLFGLFINNPDQNIPGSIEPIAVRVRNGIVTYDRFAVHIDKYTMLYQGKIDLVNRTVDLRTEVPLAALGQTFEEVKGYVDRIVVPIVTRGSLKEPKTEIDPQFDIAGAAIEAGLGGLINDALKGKGGNILDDIFGGGKKK